MYLRTVGMIFLFPSNLRWSQGTFVFFRAETSKASAGREVKRVARETRDAMVLLRHTAKHGEQQARKMHQVAMGW